MRKNQEEAHRDMRNKQEIFNWTILVALVSNALVFIGIYLGWFGPETGVGGEFCEAARKGLIKQPANTFSNFGFVLAGILAAYQLSIGRFTHNTNELTSTRFFPIFLCSLMVLLGPGSMAMHATETECGGYFDMLSMYLIAAIMFSYAFKRFFHTSTLVYVMIFATVLSVCHIFHYSSWEPPVVGFAGSFIFGVFIVTAMLMEFAHQRKDHTQIEGRWAVASSVSFLVAFAIWQVGFDGHRWCRPDSLIQAHAIWHVLCGLAVYCLFRLYASEDDRKFFNS